MSQVRSRTFTRRVAAGVVSVAMLGGALVTVAPAATAAAGPVTAASATWGFKESFRSYLGSPLNNDPGGATITVAQGTAFTGSTTVGTPARNTSSYAWPVSPVDAGSYDPVARSGSVHLGGKV